MKVMIDKKEHNFDVVKNISISCIGNNNTQTIINGNVVHECKSGSTVNIEVFGDVHGNVENVSGRIKCLNVGKNVSSVSGKVECSDIEGKVTTVSGKVTANVIKGNVSSMSGSIRTN